MQVAVEQQVLTAQATAAALQAAVARAEQLGIRVNVALADSGGVQAGFLRMPGAFLHSVEIAIDKAYTAASFGFPTRDWPKIFQQEEALCTMAHRPRLTAFGGGLPIRKDGVLIGGIGVSGGSAEEDEACARAGLRALGLEG